MNSAVVLSAAGVILWLLDTILLAATSADISFWGALLTQAPLYRIALRVLLIGVLVLWKYGRSYLKRQQVRREYGLRPDFNTVNGLRVRLFQSLLQVREKQGNEEDEHSRRLWEYASVLCDALHMEPRRMAEIRTLCWTYNIGFYALCSSSTIASYNYEGDAKYHGEIGARILEAVPGMETAADLLRYHHERWDGSGPLGLRKNSIPVGDRIFSLVWVYDALMTKRHLKNEDALRLLYDYRETALDPVLVDTFIKLMSKGSLKVIPGAQEDSMWQAN